MQTDAHVRICADTEESAAEMVDMIEHATHTIYYSSFVCTLTHPLCGRAETLETLFARAGARGVKIRILYNPEAAYGNLPPERFRELLPPSAEVRCVYGSGKLPPVARVLVSNMSFSNHHQKYMCVDGERMMIGGVEVDKERAGWLHANKADHPYCWHEVSVCVPCTPPMWQFVQDNFDRIVEAPPFPLTRGGCEHRILCRMIREARACVHMEAQTCMSAASTANLVFETVAERVARAFRTEADEFRFILLTNNKQVDESPIISWVTRQELQWSRRFLLARTAALGVPASFVAERVFVGYLEHEGRHVKVHTNILIQDGRRLLRTSSNLTDRSMSVLPCGRAGGRTTAEAVASLPHAATSNGS
jgi:phosphatidylserine/phosphatidylglycerophosphate/cardiolipin synthase-like enzyme